MVRTFSRVLAFVLIVILVLLLVASQLVRDYSLNDSGVRTFLCSNTVDDLQLETSVNETINFEGFDNVTGADEYIIPNIIHFIRFNRSEFNFIDYIVLKAAMRNHKPDYFLLHTDTPEESWTGKYWNWVRKDGELMSRIKILHLDVPKEVFGQPLSEGWRYFHGSDLGRIYVLMKYGGIYLDTDVYVVQSLNKYRNFEFVLDWNDNEFMGNQVFMAHKNARFLRHLLDTYREYRSDLWYYNGGEKPTAKVLTPHPELVHRLKGNFGVAIGTSKQLYSNPQFEWRKLDTVHLLINHRSYLDWNYDIIPNFNEVNIQNYDYPVGEMAREIMNKP